eukprot:COSAG05_NODE_5159_length_1249_cov_1.530435_2_plen_43_part_01
MNVTRCRARWNVCCKQIKNRKFGMMAQGVSIGYVLSSVLEAFV